MAKKVKNFPNLNNDGVLTIEKLKNTPGFPAEEDFNKGLIAVIECDEDIPCNPCEDVCSNSAIKVGTPITNLPVLYASKCTGCLKCLFICPGLCIFAIDKNFNESHALVYIPYEYSPMPVKGEIVQAVDRKGDFVCEGKVHKVLKPVKKQNSAVIGILVPKKFYNVVRHFKH